MIALVYRLCSGKYMNTKCIGGMIILDGKFNGEKGVEE